MNIYVNAFGFCVPFISSYILFYMLFSYNISIHFTFLFFMIYKYNLLGIDFVFWLNFMLYLYNAIFTYLLE